jgi:hypothetical protein
MNNGNASTATDLIYPFINPWRPSKQIHVETLKRWQEEDTHDLSLRRDIAATNKLCEMLNVVPEGEAKEHELAFRELIDLGYAGYCYLDFAGASYRQLLEIYGKLSRESIKDDPAVKSVNIWNWRDDLLEDAKTGREPRARIIFRNPAEPIYRTPIDPGEETMFARLKPQDAALGHDPQDTQARFVENVAEEFAGYHSGFRVMALDSRDILILAAMDLIDRLSGQQEFKALPLRIQHARAYRDVAMGRVFPSNQVGRIWFLYDTSVGMDYDVGYDDLRIGVAIGAEKVDERPLSGSQGSNPFASEIR